MYDPFIYIIPPRSIHLHVCRSTPVLINTTVLYLALLHNGTLTWAFHSRPKQNQMSPFLELPQELRLQILRLILGGRFIHVKYRESPDYSGRSLCHSICVEEETEDSVYLKFKAGQDEGLISRHRGCYQSVDESHRKLDLGVLRVCKQVYEEASLIPYTANTFSIRDPSVFEAFTQQLLPVQIQSIRALYLDVDLMSHNHTLGWTHIFEDYRSVGPTDNASRPLKLHSLHLCLAQSSFDKEYIRCCRGVGPDVWVGGFLQLQQCRLKHVTVVMTYYEASGPEEEDKLTDTEKQMYCEEIRRKLLGPRRWDRAAALYSESLALRRMDGGW